MANREKEDEECEGMEKTKEKKKEDKKDCNVVEKEKENNDK